jgi:hypothetical protein
MRSSRATTARRREARSSFRQCSCWSPRGVGIGLVLDAAERGSLIMLAVLAGWRLGALAALALVVYWLA